MFGWGKKKEEEKEKSLKKRQFTLAYKEEEFEIDKTYVEVTSTDGDKFKIAFYGHVHQYQDHGSDERDDRYSDGRKNVKEPTTGEVMIESPEQNIRYFLQSLNSGGQTIGYTDDPLKPTKSFVMIPKSAEILETEKHTIKFNVARIEPVEKCAACGEKK